MDIEDRVKNIELEIANSYTRLRGEEQRSRELHDKLHKIHNVHYLVFASLEVVGVWAIAIVLLFKA